MTVGHKSLLADLMDLGAEFKLNRSEM